MLAGSQFGEAPHEQVQQVLDVAKRCTKMIRQMHDELVFEVPEAEAE